MGVHGGPVSEAEQPWRSRDRRLQQAPISVERKQQTVSCRRKGGRCVWCRLRGEVTDGPVFALSLHGTP